MKKTKILRILSGGNERQADDLGVLYSSKAGYDAQRMSNLFVTLQRLNPGEGKDGLPSWLSTHPDPPDRIAAIKKTAADWQAANPGVKLSINQDQYLKSLEGLIFGEDPRQGYVEGQIFYHPELRFQFPVPANWKLNNTPTQVQMEAQENDGAMLLSIASEKTPAAAAEAFVSATKAVLVEQGDERIGGFSARRLLFDVTADQGQIRGLAYFIRKDEYVYFFLGYATPAQFSTYSSAFNQSMKGSKQLTDTSKINVKPGRLTIKKITTSKTLNQALQEMEVSQNRLKELAILNGMELEDKVPAGTLIKMVTK
jgi:predicted Zn-dependent protease